MVLLQLLVWDKQPGKTGRMELSGWHPERHVLPSRIASPHFI